MHDEQIIRTRDLLFVPFTIVAILVMWGGLWGLPGWLDWILYLLLILDSAALAVFIKRTSLDSLAASRLPIVLVCVMMASSLGRFFYAMATGD